MSSEQEKGVGIYSTPYCIKKDTDNFSNTNGYIDNKSWNCYTTNNADYSSLEITNALELQFTVPHKIPDDRTTATISCADDDPGGNHLNVYSSSVMT